LLWTGCLAGESAARSRVRIAQLMPVISRRFPDPGPNPCWPLASLDMPTALIRAAEKARQDVPAGRVARAAGYLSCQTVQSAWVGDRRAARMAGSSPARAPIMRAAARPPAQAWGGMVTASPWPRA